MSTPKERHYWSQLRSALTAGQWDTPFPAKAMNGTNLSWPELFRKFNKHCRGYGDVAEVGRQVQALALLVQAKEGVGEDGKIRTREGARLVVDEECLVLEEHREEVKAGYDILQSLQSSKFDQIHLTLAYHAYALGDPSLCVAHLESVPELLQFQNHIPNSGSTKSSTQGLLAPSVNYAPSTTSFSGSFSSVVDTTPMEIRDGRAWAMAETMRSVCLKGMALELLHPSNPNLALDVYRSALPLFSILQSELGLNVVPPCTSSSSSVANGSSTPTTLSSAPSSRPASQHYHLYHSVVQLPTLAQAAGKPDLSLFLPLRELWRWVERLLWRAVVLTAQICDIRIDEVPPSSSVNESQIGTSAQVTPPVPLWTYLAYYAASSAYWPPTFRSVHRTAVGTIHLRAFVLRYGPAGNSPLSSSTNTSQPPTPTTAKCSKSKASTATNTPISTSTSSTPRRPPWITEARSVIDTQRTILTASTKFPRAGERNVLVEEFAELVVRVWEVWVGSSIGFGFADGVTRAKGKWSETEDVDPKWVIDILTWSQTLTFHSSLVLRHLTRLLYLSSETQANKVLAKRTLRLYIQVVSKAYQASKEGIGEDMDSDAAWVETLVFGARMLCAGVGEQGRVDEQIDLGETLADLQEAKSVLEKARTRLDPEDRRLVAEVFLAEGVVLGLCGALGQDPLARPAQLRKAHESLVRSVQANATPSAYHHLALSFGRRIPISSEISVEPSSSDSAPESTPAPDPYTHAQSLKQALECAGHAVEAAPRDVRHWHLLGLLLSVKQEWAGAKEVLERGAALDVIRPEGDGDEGENEDDDSGGSEDDEGSEEANTVMQSTLTLQVPNGSHPVRVADYARAAETKSNDVGTFGNVTGYGNSSPKGHAPHRGFAPNTQPLLALPPDAEHVPSATSLPSCYSPPVSVPTTPSDSPTSIETPTPKQYALTYDEYPPTSVQQFERHLQIRMSQVALSEVVDGPEGAEEGWLQVFAWVAEKNREREKGSVTATPTTATTTTAPTPSQSSHVLRKPSKTRLHHAITNIEEASSIYGDKAAFPTTEPPSDFLRSPVQIGIKISPATPEIEVDQVDGELDRRHENGTIVRASLSDQRAIGSLGVGGRDIEKEAEKERERELGTRRGDEMEYVNEKEKKTSGESKHKRRSSSVDRERTAGADASKSKKVQQMQQILKDRVHKGRAGITTVSRKIGHRVSRNGGMRRSNSTPDFHAVLQPTSYQASSIHSRRRLSSIIHSADRTPTDSPPPPPLPSLDFASTDNTYNTTNTNASNSNTGSRTLLSPRENRLMSNLWLMSAATFRRLGKIDQAKGSIQEAEVRDEGNPGVWVQLGLYYISLRLYQHAVDTLQKARFISPDDVAATVHLSRLYLDPEVTAKFHSSSSLSSSSGAASAADNNAPSSMYSYSTTSPSSTSSPDVDLAAGMLSHLTKGRGWDVPEAWYYLARAYGMQGRKERERETLKIALEFAEGRGVRALGDALGWCL